MLPSLLRRAVFGRRRFQGLWERLHRTALAGMNIGGFEGVGDSGERWVLEHAARSTSGPFVLFDVGANVGDYAMLAADVLGDRAVIHCFEPSSAAFAELSRRTAGRSVRPHRIGLGDRPETRTLYAERPASGIASVYPRRLAPAHGGFRLPAQEEVAVETLDLFCNREGIGRIDFLKLDVEGHEVPVLKGAQALLAASAVHYIQFEFGGCNLDSATYLRCFFDLLGDRYDLHRVLRDGLRPISRYDEVLEVFVTTNYLAVLRGRAGDGAAGPGC